MPLKRPFTFKRNEQVPVLRSGFLLRLLQLLILEGITGCILEHLDQSPIFASDMEAAESKGTRVPEPLPAWRGFALLIGESEYTGHWEPLPAVKRDLDNMEAAMKALNFQVHRVENKTRTELLLALEEFRADAGYSPDSTVILYLSGHGYAQQREGGAPEEAYFVPVDAPSPTREPRDFYTKALELSQLACYSTQLRARQVLIVLDTCFSGAAMAQHVRGAGSYQEPTVEAHRAPVRLFMTAGQAQERVPGESLFTPALRRALEGQANANRDQYLTGGELCSFVQREIDRINKEKRPKNPVPMPFCGEMLDPRYARGQFWLDLGTPTPTPTPTPTTPTTPTIPCASCCQARPLHWIHLETGSFSIGRIDGFPPQKPVFTTTLPAFEALESEVTVAQYQLCVREGRCPDPVLLKSRPECNWEKEGKCNHPMNCISYSDAAQYAGFMGGSLPTELQWERMARGIEGHIYPWGNDLPTCERASFGQSQNCAGFGMLPVCTANGRSKEGLCDLAGNASEWVRDDWDASAYQTLSRQEDGHPKLNWRQLGSSTAAVRGGSFLDTPQAIRGDSRSYRDKSSTFQGTGFRVVRESK